jgi:Icc-related predicted phosphoesterase
MRLLLLSDIHCQWRDFDPARYPAVDAILCAGDITETGRTGQERFFESRAWVSGQAAHAPFYWIPGNHDLDFNGTEYADIPNTHCVLDKTVELGPFRLHGVSCSPCYNAPRLARYWDFMTTDEAVERAAYAFEPVDIVLSHSPPHGLCDASWDRFNGDTHLGSQALTNYLVAHEPKLVVCGHIHEAAGERILGATRVINSAQHWSTIEL